MRLRIHHRFLMKPAFCGRSRRSNPQLQPQKNLPALILAGLRRLFDRDDQSVVLIGDVAAHLAAGQHVDQDLRLLRIFFAFAHGNDVGIRLRPL